MEFSVHIQGLSKEFKRRDGALVKAIDDASLGIEPGEFVVLLGPSGCGKTTLLRSIAGLETPDRGSITVNDKTVYSSEAGLALPPDRRGLSMMFQSYALWPHMTARQNVRYPLENRRAGRLGRREMESKVAAVLETVGIGDLGNQFPGQLSGGQQQRVALARALVNDSSVVLFDEPLSNVDAKVREQLRIELLATQRRLGFTAIFVTHDQAEAMELATRIAVLDQGKVQQLGSPAEIYRSPATEYVAKFIGTTNELRGSLISGGHGYQTEHGDIFTGATAGPQHACLLWRPENGRISRERPVGSNAIPGQIVASLFMGSHTEYLVRSGQTRSRVWSTGPADFAVDDQVWISLRPEDLMVFPAKTGSATPAGETADANVGAVR